MTTPLDPATDPSPPGDPSLEGPPLPGYRPTLPPRQDPLNPAVTTQTPPPSPTPPPDTPPPPSSNRPSLRERLQSARQPTSSGIDTPSPASTSEPRRLAQPLNPLATKEVVAEVVDLGFTVLTRWLVKLRRPDPDMIRRLMPSPGERAAVVRPGARLVMRHAPLDMEATADAIDGAQIGIGVAKWGMRAVWDMEPLDPLDLDPKEPE